MESQKLKTAFLSLSLILLLPLLSFTQESTAKIKVVTEQANIRQQPAIDSPIVHQALQDDVLEVLDKQGEWYRIIFLQDSGEATTGFVHESLVRVISGATEVIQQPIIKPIEERQMMADRNTQLKCDCKEVPVRLSMKDAEQLKELYRLSGTPAWTPNALNLGPFFGIVEDGGSITAVAGVHYVTPFGTEIGNIATHPEHRRKGYAAACLKAVVEEVLKESELVILHYFTENTPAQRLYENMGFEYSAADPVYFVRATCRD